MISAVTYGITHGCHCKNNPGVWNKISYLEKYAIWADLAIGIILCVIGSLAKFGLIPVPGANWLIAAGCVEVILALFVKCLPCCGMTKKSVSYFLNEGQMPINFDELKQAISQIDIVTA